jgi:hypothetical protein
MRVEEGAVVGMDNLEILALANAQAGFLDAAIDFGWRPIRIGMAIPSSRTTCTARSTRSSSPSAKTMRLGASLACEKTGFMIMPE